MKLFKIILCFIFFLQLSVYSVGESYYLDSNGKAVHIPSKPIGTIKSIPFPIAYPQFRPLPLVANKQWYKMQLAANSTQGYIVAWDPVTKSSQCIATVSAGGSPVGPSCRRPPINASNQDLVDLINLQGKADAKQQQIGVLTCNSPDYVKAWGQVNADDAGHWCNVVAAKLDPKFLKIDASIRFPAFVPFLPINGQWWFQFVPSRTSTEMFLVSWDKISNKAQCLATITGTGNSAIAQCIRPTITASEAELDNLLQRQGQKDDQQRLINPLVCDSAIYVHSFGKVDPNNQDLWCNMANRLNPNPPPLTDEQKSEINNAIKRLEDSGAYPVLDRSDSVAGPDANNNGVRDDVEAYINKTWTDPKENKAVMQFARAIQAEITVDLNDKAAVKKVDKKSGDAINCLGDTIPGGPKHQKIFDEIQAITLNTVARTRAYFAFDKTQDGTVWSVPNWDTCEE